MLYRTNDIYLYSVRYVVVLRVDYCGEGVLKKEEEEAG